MGALWADQKLKKIIIFKCHVLLFYAITTNHFSSGLWHVIKSDFIWQLAMTSSFWTEKQLQSTSQSQTCKKVRSWSLFGLVVFCSRSNGGPVWSTTAFWIPVKSCLLRIMLSKLMRCTPNPSVCSWHWLTECAQFFSTTTSDHKTCNQCFKS